jgi:regulator of protease activity HflC (stomatin/prohibitin superfamily)
MNKLKTGYIIAALVLMNMISSCNRIDAGHVGLKVNLYGTDRGVQDVTEVTGWVFYNPFGTSVYEFATYVQHVEYTGDQAFVIQSKDGSEFTVSPMVNYSVIASKVPAIFRKYRKDLSDIESEFLKTAVYEAYRITANEYEANLLISKRQEFDFRVKKELEKQLKPEGFIVNQFTSSLVYPNDLKKAIEAKNKAVQTALQAENNVKTAEANARISVAKAEGEYKTIVLGAEAQAKANNLKQSTLTPMLLQQQWIEKWNGVMPQYQLGSGQNLYMPLK